MRENTPELRDRTINQKSGNNRKVPNSKGRCFDKDHHSFARKGMYLTTIEYQLAKEGLNLAGMVVSLTKKGVC